MCKCGHLKEGGVKPPLTSALWALIQSVMVGTQILGEHHLLTTPALDPHTQTRHAPRLLKSTMFARNFNIVGEIHDTNRVLQNVASLHSLSRHAASERVRAPQNMCLQSEDARLSTNGLNLDTFSTSMKTFARRQFAVVSNLFIWSDCGFWVRKLLRLVAASRAGTACCKKPRSSWCGFTSCKRHANVCQWRSQLSRMTQLTAPPWMSDWHSLEGRVGVCERPLPVFERLH